MLFTQTPALRYIFFTRRRLDLDKLLASNFEDRRVIHSTFGSACYIDDSFPSMLYLAFKYAGESTLSQKKKRENAENKNGKKLGAGTLQNINHFGGRRQKQVIILCGGADN